MRGYLCQRKAGWDTHGLPVEVEVCKELGIHSKEEIEAFGVEPFIRKCVESVFRYTQQWEQLTERLGFWIHLDEAYVTFHQSYVESVWWALKTLFDRGLLYQGHKIVWWWAQGGTALSSGEVGQGYREVADPSVFVRFPLVGAAESCCSLSTPLRGLCSCPPQGGLAKSARLGACLSGSERVRSSTSTPLRRLEDSPPPSPSGGREKEVPRAGGGAGITLGWERYTWGAEGRGPLLVPGDT